MENAKVNTFYRPGYDGEEDEIPVVEGLSPERSSSIYCESLPSHPLIRMGELLKQRQHGIAKARNEWKTMAPSTVFKSTPQRCIGTRITEGTSKTAPTPSNAPIILSIATPSSMESVPTALEPLSSAANDRLRAEPIEERELYPNHVAWIVPPRLPRSHIRRWDKYELSEAGNETAWVYRGQNYKPDGPSYFDHRLGRRLYPGDDWVPGARVVQWERFGAPVPRHAFYIQSDEKYKPQRPSSWMYPSVSIPRQDEGLIAPTPLPEELPLLVRADRGKGKSERYQGYESDEDVVGIPASPARSSTEEQAVGEDDHMLIDPMEEIATNVVMIEGLDHKLLAQQLAANLRDNFYRASVHPLAIINAQRAMWIRLADTTEGFCLRGALNGSDPSYILTYKEDGDFRDAYQYTTDRWVREQEPGVQEEVIKPVALSVGHPPELLKESLAEESASLPLAEESAILPLAEESVILSLPTKELRAEVETGPSRDPLRPAEPLLSHSQKPAESTLPNPPPLHQSSIIPEGCKPPTMPRSMRRSAIPPLGPRFSAKGKAPELVKRLSSPPPRQRGFSLYKKPDNRAGHAPSGKRATPQQSLAQRLGEDPVDHCWTG
ncbi:hypothetical protein B0H19DRAFT_1261202 [Mycena capillaripes]|nr:hypothetical protein B0H19DRAFT_1261202 [Mycena capillaripes]